ncbi:MAG: glycosyltransferase family 4 protein, partial [Candidatus Aegiribacteria sp.]|nr:glycosyltransferase family 4 protein [Candidatus Aegiribacteria sp.]
RYLERNHDSILISLAGEESGWTGKGVFSLAFNTPYDPFIIPSLLDLKDELDLSKAEIIHAHLFPSQLITGLIREAMPLRARFATTEHSTANRRRETTAGRLIDRWFYQRFCRVICVSLAAASELAEWIPEVSGKLEVIFNGIDLSEFSDKPRARGTGSKTILSVGRLTEAKNYLAAIEAFSLLRSRTSLDLQYCIAGGGTLETVLKKYALELGVSDSVKFLGEVSDISSLMKQADVFFMPSSREGFGIAAVEAMASGLPVVASNLPGIGDVVGRDQHCGILVDPGSPSEMAEALLRLLEDDILSWRMGSNGSERAGTFSIEITTDKYLELYENILKKEH